jgi:hypothetical protein
MRAARLLLLLAAGCSSSPGPSGIVDAGVSLDARPVIDEDTVPCARPELWPLSLVSTEIPAIVHFRGEDERTKAVEVLGYLERSWQVEVDELGFSAPVADDGLCGPDGKFDVFLWRGVEVAYVDIIGDNPATAHDDQIPFMVVDAWGPYAGPILDSTIAHEFNHACQAADDWYDSPIVFEMTSTFLEEAVYDDDDEYRDLLVDFQGNPDWSLDRDDEYASWYMYGAALYLHYLRARYFDGSYAFAAAMWRGMRNVPGDNEPDWEDALDTILMAEAGIGFLDTVPEFARWRWYTGARDDGMHFDEGGELPDDAAVAMSATIAVGSRDQVLSPAPMMLGSSYLELTRGTSDPETVTVALVSAATGVRWVVQALPGLDGTDGEILDVSGGAATVRFPASNRRTIVVTAMPAGADDPDSRTDTRHPVTLQIR